MTPKYKQQDIFLITSEDLNLSNISNDTKIYFTYALYFVNEVVNKEKHKYYKIHSSIFSLNDNKFHSESSIIHIGCEIEIYSNLLKSNASMKDMKKYKKDYLSNLIFK